MAGNFFGGQFFGGGFFGALAPSAPVDQGQSIPIPPSGGVAGGGIAVGPVRIQAPFVPEKKLYRFKHNTENSDRRDIQDIMEILAKGGFL